MAKDTKKEERVPEYWCECECANCDIGAHERCSSPKCHMQNGRIERANEKLGSNWPLLQILLRELTKLEFKFFRRVNSLLYEEGVHGVNGGSKPVLARQSFHRLLEADQFFALVLIKPLRGVAN